MGKHVDEGEGQDLRGMKELGKLLGIDEGEREGLLTMTELEKLLATADAKGMKELEELVESVDAEKIKAGEVKKAPKGKELGKILARHLGKGRPVALERWLRQRGK